MICVVEHDLCRLLASPEVAPEPYPAREQTPPRERYTEVEIACLAPFLVLTSAFGAWVWFLPWE